MPIGIYDKNDIDELAEEIRYCKGGGSLMTVKEMKDEIQNVRENGFNDGWSDGHLIGIGEGRAEGLEEGKAIGYTEGKTDGITEGIEQGKKSQYDEFWENHLAEPKATGSGALIFAGRGWNDKTFNPPCKIDFVTNGYQMFAYAGNIPKEKLAMVDYSKITTNFNQIFMYSNVAEIPRIDTRGSSTVSSVFSGTYYLTTIEALVIREDGSQTINDYCFANCPALENIIIEGVISSNNFNMQWSTKLSKASITSIINALSTTTNGLTVTISKTAINNAFNGGSTGDEWLNLVATKNNWTISLI